MWFFPSIYLFWYVLLPNCYATTTPPTTHLTGNLTHRRYSGTQGYFCPACFYFPPWFLPCVEDGHIKRRCMYSKFENFASLLRLIRSLICSAWKAFEETPGDLESMSQFSLISGGMFTKAGRCILKPQFTNFALLPAFYLTVWCPPERMDDDDVLACFSIAQTDETVALLSISLHAFAFSVEGISRSFPLQAV